jgi:hypothetical protein
MAGWNVRADCLPDLVGGPHDSAAAPGRTGQRTSATRSGATSAGVKAAANAKACAQRDHGVRIEGGGRGLHVESDDTSRANTFRRTTRHGASVPRKTKATAAEKMPNPNGSAALSKSPESAQTKAARAKSSEHTPRSPELRRSARLSVSFHSVSPIRTIRGYPPTPRCSEGRRTFHRLFTPCSRGMARCPENSTPANSFAFDVSFPSGRRVPTRAVDSVRIPCEAATGADGYPLPETVARSATKFGSLRVRQRPSGGRRVNAAPPAPDTAATGGYGGGEILVP